MYSGNRRSNGLQMETIDVVKIGERNRFYAHEFLASVQTLLTNKILYARIHATITRPQPIQLILIAEYCMLCDSVLLGCSSVCNAWNKHSQSHWSNLNKYSEIRICLWFNISKKSCVLNWTCQLDFDFFNNFDMCTMQSNVNVWTLCVNESM